MIKPNRIRFAIGEIVKITEGRKAGAICIVEEIVNDAQGDEHRGGRYSLYGWAQPNPADKHDIDFPKMPYHWYFGDYIGTELESTGHIASAEEVLNYGNIHNFQGGHWKDIEFIVAHLGHTGTLTRQRAMFT